MQQITTFKNLIGAVKKCRILNEDLSDLSETKPLPDIIVAYDEERNDFKVLDISALKKIYGTDLKPLLFTYTFLERMIKETHTRFINADTLKALVSACIANLEGFPSSYMTDIVVENLIERR